ncbi:MAG: hypothetical protein P8H03_05105, partial [Emcibacteraceae bacterium]|nr:hypothetical protein [Emcibacteraceae bacterium]
MFMSANDGESWDAFQQNLPVTPITDIKFIRGDLAISTMGRGFWVLDNVQSAAAAASAGGDMLSVLKPKDTFRYRHPRGVPTDGTSAGVPELPRPGVEIDYYVPEGDHASIKLEILDSAGDVITTYVNDGSEQDDKDVDAPMHIVDEDLEKDAGLNRFRWNMTQLGAWHSTASRRYNDGPIATPGAYSARVSVGGQTSSASFNLIADPRVTDQGINVTDIAKQTEMQGHIAALLTNARKLEEQAKAEHGALHRKYAGQSNEERGVEANADFDRVHTAVRTLGTPNIIYPKAGLVGMISYLYNINSDADQVPGKDSVDRFAELSAEYDAVEAAYKK